MEDNVLKYLKVSDILFQVIVAKYFTDFKVKYLIMNTKKLKVCELSTILTHFKLF